MNMARPQLTNKRVEYMVLEDQVLQHDSFQQKHASVGIATTKAAFTKRDGILVPIVLLCFGVAATSVFSQKVAVYLGHTNQLVIVGFCLAVMGLVCQRQVIFTFLLYTVHTGSASLQDIEAILSNSIFITNSSRICRCVLLFMAALPLGLGVAYKRFVGGSSIVEITSRAGLFGLSSPPGYQRIGLGLTMIPQVYLPFWLDPNVDAAYSFSLLVQSNDTSAVLDIPLPDYVNMIRDGLRADESMVIVATVNATVSEAVPIDRSLRQNTTYWQRSEQAYPPVDLFYGVKAFFANDHINHTLTYVGFWNDTAGQTPGGQVQQNVITRRLCLGTWKINSANITLLDGTVLETAEEARAKHDQTIITRNQMEITDLFGRFVVEYDWHRYPRSRPVNTVPSLTATMIWSRLVAMCSLGVAPGADDWSWTNHYEKLPDDLVTYKERVTLQRSVLLLLVIIVLPIISLLSIAGKIVLRTCPIGDGFGLTSVLAAIDSRTLDVTKGSSLSGRLSREVGIHFAVAQSSVDQSIIIKLDQTGASACIDRSILYR